jgi:predicted alpha/beta-hydrolase family hydrolase
MTVTVLHEPATNGSAIATFVCAHGAGGNMHDRGMEAVAKELRGRGLDVVRFNFPYSEKKSGRPDPMPVLRSRIEEVVAQARASRTIIGGRSMGGRAASMLAADGFGVDGLLLLAYPLHPSGKPEQLRDAHLPRITMPTLCLNGTRDALCRRDLMDAVVPHVGANFQMHWLEGADHSFHVLKSSGRTDADVMSEIGDATQRWLQETSSWR